MELGLVGLVGQHVQVHVVMELKQVRSIVKEKALSF
jgi:hypothetical protein